MTKIALPRSMDSVMFLIQETMPRASWWLFMMLSRLWVSNYSACLSNRAQQRCVFGISMSWLIFIGRHLFESLWPQGALSEEFTNIRFPNGAHFTECLLDARWAQKFKSKSRVEFPHGAELTRWAFPFQSGAIQALYVRAALCKSLTKYNWGDSDRWEPSHKSNGNNQNGEKKNAICSGMLVPICWNL